MKKSLLSIVILVFSNANLVHAQPSWARYFNAAIMESQHKRLQTVKSNSDFIKKFARYSTPEEREFLSANLNRGMQWESFQTEFSGNYLKFKYGKLEVKTRLIDIVEGLVEIDGKQVVIDPQASAQSQLDEILKIIKNKDVGYSLSLFPEAQAVDPVSLIVAIVGVGAILFFYKDTIGATVSCFFEPPIPDINSIHSLDDARKAGADKCVQEEARGKEAVEGGRKSLVELSQRIKHGTSGTGTN